MDFDAIIFDNDGVLVDTADIAAAVFTRVVAEHGVVVSRSLADSLFGASMPAAIEAVRAETGHQLPNSVVDRFHEAIAMAVAVESRALPGAAELLGALEVPVAVASNGTRSRIEASLRCAGLFDWFDGRVFSAWDVARRKPAPDVFLAAAESLGVRPEACVVVEDSPEGIEAARAANMIPVQFGLSAPQAAEFVASDMNSLGVLLGVNHRNRS